MILPEDRVLAIGVILVTVPYFVPIKIAARIKEGVALLLIAIRKTARKGCGLLTVVDTIGELMTA